MTSANATWLDARELAGIEHACKTCTPTLSSMYGHMAETFSVMPLAGMAAALLARQLPRLWGDAKLPAVNLPGEPLRDFGVICSDFTGITSGVRVECLGDHR